MGNSTRNPFSEIVIGLIITILGGVIVAWVIREGELFQSAPKSQSLNQIPIALTNNNCNSQDFYIDGVIVVSSIEPNTISVFQTTPGQHYTHTCLANTNNCTRPVIVDWSSSSPVEYSISRAASCPIEITLKNGHCEAQNIFVDNQLVVSSIQPGATTVFSIVPGQHEINVCRIDSGFCDNKQIYTWTVSQDFSISRGVNCP